jgi:hypothetical protein
VATELHEPLAETAGEARGLAARHCDGCAWYHGVWQYLRLLGVAAAPDRHAAFLFDALTGRARHPEASRVLVSGSADYGMLAHVVRAYEAAGSTVEPTVVDRCETPTLLCQDYGKRAGVVVGAAVTDILDYGPGETFDVICTHSFLSQFPAALRPELMARWRALLRAGGKVVTTTRITPQAADGGERLAFTEGQAAAFCTQVRDEAVRLQGVLDQSPDELVAAARQYTQRLVLHPTRSVDEVAGLFEGGGFIIERLDVRTVTGAVRGGGSGPGTSQTATYAEVVAVRA